MPFPGASWHQIRTQWKAVAAAQAFMHRAFQCFLWVRGILTVELSLAPFTSLGHLSLDSSISTASSFRLQLCLKMKWVGCRLRVCAVLAFVHLLSHTEPPVSSTC